MPASQYGPIDYTIAQEELLDAIQAHQLANFTLKGLALFCAGFGVLIAVITWTFGTEGQRAAMFGSFALGGVIGLVIVAAAIRWIVAPLSARRQYAQSAALCAEQTLSFDREKLYLNSELGDMRMPWGKFHKWHEGKRMILIYQNAQMFNLIPKRALSEDQLAGLLGFLHDHGPKAL
jgi:murein endopeptidase